MQIKITVTIFSKNFKSDSTNVGRNVEEKQLLYTTGGNVDFGNI